MTFIPKMKEASKAGWIKIISTALGRQSCLKGKMLNNFASLHVCHTLSSY